MSASSATVAPAPGVPLASPLYREVKRGLMEALASGEWKAGEAIPSERRLAERYAISIGTVRKAIDELVSESLLIRQQGRGTFVASHNRDRLLFYFFHVVAHDGTKQYPEVRLLSFARARADRTASDKLGIALADPVLRVRNLLSLGEAPVIVDDITLPAVRFSGMSERAFRERPSTIYNFYQESFGVSVVRTVERLRATVADPDIALLLELPVGSPVLQITRVALTYADAPVELRISHVDTRRHEYLSELKRI